MNGDRVSSFISFCLFLFLLRFLFLQSSNNALMRTRLVDQPKWNSCLLAIVLSCIVQFQHWLPNQSQQAAIYPAQSNQRTALYPARRPGCIPHGYQGGYQRGAVAYASLQVAGSGKRGEQAWRTGMLTPLIISSNQGWISNWSAQPANLGLAFSSWPIRPQGWISHLCKSSPALGFHRA